MLRASILPFGYFFLAVRTDFFFDGPAFFAALFFAADFFGAGADFFFGGAGGFAFFGGFALFAAGFSGPPAAFFAAWRAADAVRRASAAASFFSRARF
jgi:hypothetical protein